MSATSQTSPGRIVFVLRSLERGGTQRQVFNLASALQRQGVAVEVAVFYSDGAFLEKLRENRVSVTVIGKSSRSDFIGFVVRLIRHLRSRRPEVIYSFLPWPNVVVAVLRPLLHRTVLVWAIRASGIDETEETLVTRLLRQVEGRVSRWVDLCISNSTSGRTDAISRGVPPGRIVVIPNGIDVDYFHPMLGSNAAARRRFGIPGDAIVVGRVARLHPMKDHETFLAAAAMLRASVPKAYFVWIGDAPWALRQQFDHCVRRFELQGVVSLLPPQDDMPAAYGVMDVAVSSSAYGEGLPNVVSEAMACGIPCVVTDVGDSAQIVRDLTAVVPPRDPVGLARALAELVELVAGDDGAVLRKAVRQRVIDELSLDSLTSLTVEQIAKAREGASAATTDHDCR